MIKENVFIRPIMCGHISSSDTSYHTMDMNLLCNHLLFRSLTKMCSSQRHRVINECQLCLGSSYPDKVGQITTKIFIPEVRTLCILILEIQSWQILSHKKKLLRTLWVESVSFLLEYVAACGVGPFNTNAGWRRSEVPLCNLAQTFLSPVTCHLIASPEEVGIKCLGWIFWIFWNGQT